MGEYHENRPAGALQFLSGPMMRSNAVYKTIIKDKIFYKSTDGSFGRSIVCKEGKPIPRVRIYSSKNKTLSLIKWK